MFARTARKAYRCLGGMILAAGAAGTAALGQDRPSLGFQEIIQVQGVEKGKEQGKDDKKGPIKLPEVKVPGEATTPPPPVDFPTPPSPFGPGGIFDRNVTSPFLPDVEGTQINAGKKTTNIDLRQQPPIANNNLRQLLITTPGLLVSEESTPLTSIGYRGLEPHRAQFTQLLKDGIPIHADMFGYPEAYYVPPLQIVDRVEFLHGGASLMFGPQPGGSLNFITKLPPTDRAFTAYAENMGGNFGFFSTFESVAGTVGNLGYYLYGHHRQSDGFRDSNSAYNLDYGGGKFVVNVHDTARLIVGFDSYREGHGEPGGLTRAAFDADITTTTRLFDRFELERQSGTLTYQQVLTEDLFLEVRMWTIDYSRFSRRQRTSANAANAFGTAPSGANSTTSSFELQEFRTFGFEPRLRFDYNIGAIENTLTAGFMYYYTDSPREDSRGPNLAETGTQLRNSSTRTVEYLPFFAENLVRLGKLDITPGIRVENFRQSVQEHVNLDKNAAGVALDDRTVTDSIPLLGLGLAYNFTDKVQAYGNVSEAYRPIIFTQAVVAAANQTVAGDLQAGDSWQAEIGFRGNPAPWFYWDTSLFYMEFSNQIGTVANVIQNVGDSRHQGWEFAGQIDLLGLRSAWLGEDDALRVPSLGVFFNSTVLDAVFEEGPNKGKTPQYAPDHILRGGVTFSLRDVSGAYDRACCDDGAGCEASGGRGANPYGARDWLRIWFTGTFVGEHFADDGNTSTFFVPSYKVWDLTAEAKIWGDYITVFGGVYNIFDSRYFARVRADGIDPAMPRNYFVGLKLYW